MSVEVDSLMYWFLPEEEDLYLPSIPQADEGDTRGDILDDCYSPPPEPLPEPIIEPTPPFRYNPMHDLESIWWIAVDFIFNREVLSVGGKSASELDIKGTADFEKQLEFVNELFCDRTRRRDIFKRTGTFQERVANLHGSVRDIAKELERARKTFCEQYQDLEKTPELIKAINPRSAAKVYRFSSRLFVSIRKHLAQCDIEVKELVRPLPMAQNAASKRQAVCKAEDVAGQALEAGQDHQDRSRSRSESPLAHVQRNKSKRRRQASDSDYAPDKDEDCEPGNSSTGTVEGRASPSARHLRKKLRRTRPATPARDTEGEESGGE